MVYVEITVEVPRNKVQEILTIYQKKILPWDKEHVEKAGGKVIGFWWTEYGKMGEITSLFAYPSLDARAKVTQAFREDPELQKEAAEYLALTPSMTVKVLRPASFSPLQ